MKAASELVLKSAPRRKGGRRPAPVVPNQPLPLRQQVRGLLFLADSALAEGHELLAASYVGSAYRLLDELYPNPVNQSAAS